MDRLNIMLEKYIEPFMEKVDENAVMSALKAGSMATTPFLIFGGFIMIILNFPGLSQIAPDVSIWLNDALSPLIDCTFGFTGIIMLVGISTTYAKELEIHGIYATITAILCFMIVTPFQVTQDVSVNGVLQTITLHNVLSTQVFGFRSMISAIIVALISVKIFAIFYHHNIIIHMPKSIPELVGSAFTTILPSSFALLLFLIFRLLLEQTPFVSLTDCIYSLCITPLLGIGNNIFSFIGITQIIANLLWFFGIHGTNVVEAVWGPVQQTMSVANLEAFRAGVELPYIATSTFRSVYGITNVYVIMLSMLLVMRSKRMKKVAKISMIPAFFCISEPMMFGLPIFMNPVLLFPFLVCSSVQFGLAYLLCAIHIAPIPVIPTPWTTPIFINVLISTNWNFMGVVTQVILLLVGVMIWYPFMKMLDRRYQKEECDMQKQLDEETIE